MKKIILVLLGLFLFNSAAVACEGDCVLCHPKLTEMKDDMAKDHAVLSTCKTCHTQEEMEKIDMGNGCGEDCWDCHDINKVVKSKVKEHNGLQKCIDCHVSINKNMWGGKELSSDLSAMPTLDEMVNEKSSKSGEVKITTKSIEKLDKELNKSFKEAVSSELTLNSELTVWSKIGNFFVSLWSKFIGIFL